MNARTGTAKVTGAAGAAAHVVDRAAAEGLLDIAYGSVETPLGRMLAAVTPRGLVRLAFPTERPDDVLEELSVRISPRVLESGSRLDEVRREIEQYFEGRRRRFEVPLDWRLTRGFRRRVLRATARVPFGRTSTYAQMASKAGSPHAYRAAGSALGSNPIPVIVPCHRILQTGGGLGGYGGGLEVKEYLLRLEGAS